MADMVSIALVATDQVSGPARAAAGALGAIEMAAGRSIGVLTSLAGAAAKTAAALAAVGTGAAAAFAASSVQTAASFEKQISAIGAVSGLVGDQLKQVADLALELGKATSFSATESAQGIEELIKAGVRMQDVMGGAAKASLDLAAAGGVSVKEAAELMSNAMNAFSISGERAAHVADIIAGAANASAIDVNEFKFSLASVGAVAATVGVSFEDTATAIALLGNAGIKGSDAGTSLKTMLLNLQPATKEQKKAFQELGLITADGANKFFTAEGRAKSLAEIAGVLQEATKNMTEQQKLATLEVLFGTDAIRAAAILTKAGAAGFRDLAGAMGAVAATDVAEQRLDNLAGSLEKLGGSWETVRIKMGRPFLPILKRGVDALTEALNRAEPALTAFAERAAAGLDRLITRAQQAAPRFLAFGTATVALARYVRELARDGDYLNDWVTHLPPQMQAATVAVGRFVVQGVEQLRAALGKIRGLMAGGDLAGGAQMLLGGLIGAFRQVLPVVESVGRAVLANVTETFRFLADRVLPPVVSIVQQTGAVLERTLLPAAAATGAVLRGIFGDTLDWLARTVWPPFLSIVQQTAEFWTGTILPTLPAIGAALRTTLGETVQWLASDVWPRLRSAAEVAWGFISGTIVPALPGFAAQLRGAIGTALAWIAETGWPAFLAAARTAWQFVSGTIVPLLPQLAAQIRGALGAALEWVATTGWPLLISAGQAVIAWITGTAIPALTQLADWLGPKIQAAAEWVISTGWPSLVAAGQAVSDWITGTAVPALTQLWDWLSPKLQAAIEWVSTTGWPLLVSAGAAVYDWVMNQAVPALTQLWDWLSPKLEAAVTWITGTGWPTLVSTGGQVYDWIMTQAVPALTELVSWLQEKTQPAVQWLSETGWPGLVSAGEKAVQLFKDIVTWVQEFWAKLEQRGVIDDLARAFRDLWEAGEILVTTFWPQTTEGAEQAFTATDVFVELVKGAAKFLEAFAAGVNTIAKALRDLKEAASGLPDWMVEWIRRSAGASPALPGIVNPFLPAPGARQTAAPSGTYAASPLASQARWSEADVRQLQDRILTEMPKPPAFDPNATVEERMRRWAPTLQWLEANTGFKASALAGLIMAENAFGASALSSQGNNYFSIARSPYDRFALPGDSRFPAYPSPEANIARAIGLILHPENTNYAQAAARRGDVEGLIEGLIAGGYIVDEPGFPVATWAENVRAGSRMFEGVAGSTPLAQPASLIPSGITNFRQTQQEWSQWASDANAICGPYLAALFADAVGRPPSPEEARALAERFGIYSSAGGGSGILNASQFDEYATALIQQINPGAAVSVQQTAVSSAAEASRLAQAALAGGSPIVGFNTPLHYFGATAFDPATGRFNVGGTGLSLRGGSEWMTIEEIAGLGQGLTAVITLLGEVPAAAQGAASAMPPLAERMDEVTSATIDTRESVTAAEQALGTLPPAAAEAADGAGAAAETITATFDVMREGTLSSVTDLGEGILTTFQDTAGNTIATVTSLTGEVTSQSATLANGVSLNLADMNVKSTTSVNEMAGTITRTVTDLAGNTIVTTTDMHGQVVSQFVTMQAEAGSAVAQLAQEAGEQFGNISAAATETQEPIAGVQETMDSLEPPEVGPIVSAFDQIKKAARDVERQAERTAEAIKDIHDAVKGGKSGSGGSNKAKAMIGFEERQHGGPVEAGSLYLVGERGPEWFIPNMSGRIIPRADGSAVAARDDERIVAALDRLERSLSRPNVVVQGTEERIVAAVLRAIRQHDTLLSARGPR